jgi:hypothetical protein
MFDISERLCCPPHLDVSTTPLPFRFPKHPLFPYREGSIPPWYWNSGILLLGCRSRSAQQTQKVHITGIRAIPRKAQPTGSHELNGLLEVHEAAEVCDTGYPVGVGAMADLSRAGGRDGRFGEFKW